MSYGMQRCWLDVGECCIESLAFTMVPYVVAAEFYISSSGDEKRRQKTLRELASDLQAHFLLRAYVKTIMSFQGGTPP